MSRLCGHTLENNKSCKVKVTEKGLRCYRHRNKSPKKNKRCVFLTSDDKQCHNKKLKNDDFFCMYHWTMNNTLLTINERCSFIVRNERCCMEKFEGNRSLCYSHWFLKYRMKQVASGN